MLQSVTGVLTRHFLLQPLVHSQRDIDADIAVGVGPELPSGGVCLACLLVEVFFRRDQNSEIVRTSHVGLRQPSRPLGDRPVADHLLRADFHPLVPQSSLNSCRQHLVHERLVDVAIHAHLQLPRFTCILVGAQILRSTHGVRNRGDSGARHHLRDQTHAFAMVVAREVGRNNLVEGFPASLAHVPRQMAGGRIAIVLAAGRIGSMVINLCQLDRRRVDPRRMPASMLDVCRMAGNGSV